MSSETCLSFSSFLYKPGTTLFDTGDNRKEKMLKVSITVKVQPNAFQTGAIGHRTC